MNEILIGRYPAGLLELIGSKNLGVTPTSFSGAQFSVDITSCFGQWETERQVNAALAEAGSVLITVPPNTWWRLIAVSMHIEVTATQSGIVGSIRLSPQVTSASTAALSRGKWNEDQLNPSVTALGFCLTQYVPSSPLLLPPGATLWGYLDLLGTDATANVALQALYAPLS